MLITLSNSLYFTEKGARSIEIRIIKLQNSKQQTHILV